MSGKDVFIPIDWVVGGKERVGQGWRMLMACLAAGRAISLPAAATAGAKALLRSTGAYARIRKQFSIPIGRMEGIIEKLADMVETAYTLEAARAVTSAMVSQGAKPAVISGLMKYQATERTRRSLDAALDIHGGKGICDGPHNYLQAAYQISPVSITVEGANILSRSLIVFAQGALRSHPYLFAEIQAAGNPDRNAGFEAFEKAFEGHMGFAVSNVYGAFFHNVTGGIFARSPLNAPKPLYYAQLERASTNFALMADMCVALLGGGLKLKQRTTGRMADALSELYFISCLLKRYEDDGALAEDRPIFDYAVRKRSTASTRRFTTPSTISRFALCARPCAFGSSRSAIASGNPATILAGTSLGLRLPPARSATGSRAASSSPATSPIRSAFSK